MDINGFTDFTDTPTAFRHDAQLPITFDHILRKNEAKSTEDAPVFDKVEVISIMHPGSREVTFDEVTDIHRERFNRQYVAWKKSLAEGTARPMDGTPLGFLTTLEPERIKVAESFHIFTVEQLALASDNAVQSMGMGWDVQRRNAKAYLKTVEENSLARQFAGEMEALKAEVAELRAKKK